MSQSAEIIYDVNLYVLSHNTHDTLCTVVIFIPTKKRRLLTGKRSFDENVVLFLFYIQCLDELPNGWMVIRQKFGKTAMPVDC